uniref:non-specific protein-tyrosine kinase n=1 Tax=Pristionchus pacificus TaxID=54126 RepID=A0A2A6CFE3_PRIPA|eukprot:PDM76836.1 protein kinase [Pristionchus pacificus]
MSGAGLYIEEALLDVLEETGLVQFQNILCIDLHLRRIEHFEHAKDKDLIAHGIPPPAVRRLRVALADKKRKSSLGSSNRKRDSEAMMRPNNENAQPLSAQETIKLMERLGEGSFAVVKRAFWTRPNGQKLDVAVKILRDASPLVMEEMQAEAANLRRLQHPNLIQLYGVVEQPAMMVLELCPGGALLDRLRDRTKGTLLISQLLDYCRQMCKGMTYLETKHCVHRDLAARNILLSADEKTVKICDFGLMRLLEDNERMYVMSPQKKVPFAWCPPEALRHRQFSHASDVYSMGVAMWEIFTYGEEPWVGLKGIDVLQKVEAGQRLEKPRRCSVAIYELMLLCWKLNPDHRPKFNLLRGFLNQNEMPTAVVRDAYDSQEEGALYLEKKDQVIVIENTGILWFGQSLRTRLFGSFPRGHVFMDGSEQRRETTSTSTSTRSTGGSRHGSTSSATARNMGGHAHITLPIKGSFIHAGHGDIGGSSWGSPNLIDEIYLKNPVMGQPLVSLGHSTPIVAPLPPPKKPSTLNISPGRGLNLHLDTPDSFDEFQNEDMSPSNIHIPAPLNGFGRPSTTTTSTGLQATRPAPSRPVSVVAAPAAAPTWQQQQQQPRPPHPYYEPPREDTPTHQPMSGAFGGGAGGGIPLTPLQPRDYGITPVPRPAAAGTSTTGRSQSASRAVNNTPPPISATAYMPPSTSSAAGLSSILRPSNGHSQLNYYGGWRSSSRGETPLLNHSQMGSMQRGVSYAPSTSGVNDPFMISDAVRTLSQPRHSEYIDASRVPVSHPPSTSSSNLSKTSSSPSFNPALLSSQPLRPSVIAHPVSNPPSHRSSPVQQSSASPTPSLQPLQPLQPAPVQQQQQRPPAQQQQPLQPQPAAAAAPKAAVQQQQQQQQRPTFTMASSSSSTTAPTRDPAAPAAAAAAAAARHSTIGDSFLPPPSALFYGSSNPSSARSSPLTTGQSQQTTSSSSPSFPSSTATPTPAAAAAPAATRPSLPAEAPFSSSVLQPTRVGAAVPTPPTQQQLISTKPAAVPQQQQQQANAEIPSLNRPYGLENGANTQMPLFAIQNSSRALNSLHNSPYTPAYSMPQGAGGYGSLQGYGDAAAALYGGYGTITITIIYPPRVGFFVMAKSRIRLLILLSFLIVEGIYGGYGNNGYGTGAYGYGTGAYGGYGSMGPMGGAQTLIYPSLNSHQQSVLPPALGPTTRSGIEVPEGASREDVIRLLDPLSSSSSSRSTTTTTPAATAASSTAAAEAARPPSPGRQAAELEALYSEAFFTDRRRCDFMVKRLNGRVDLALRELKKEYLVDTGIARDAQQAEMALIAKDWNLNSAADAVLTGAL